MSSISILMTFQKMITFLIHHYFDKKMRYSHVSIIRLIMKDSFITQKKGCSTFHFQGLSNFKKKNFTIFLVYTNQKTRQIVDGFFSLLFWCTILISKALFLSYLFLNWVLCAAAKIFFKCYPKHFFYLIQWRIEEHKEDL